jgi:hypothetical protein
MRRINGLTVPCDNQTYPGGTDSWFNYLNKRKILKAFDYKLEYPVGTLFLCPYFSMEDQGHMAVLYDISPFGCLHSKIIHSMTNDKFNNLNSTLYPGVTVEHTLGQSHFYHAIGYYYYYCLPEDWLSE